MEVPEAKYYRHFKGKLYRLITIARHSETLEEMVVYQTLYDGSIWVRPVEMFFGEVERDGYAGPRFKPVALEDIIDEIPEEFRGLCTQP